MLREDEPLLGSEDQNVTLCWHFEAPLSEPQQPLDFRLLLQFHLLLLRFTSGRWKTCVSSDSGLGLASWVIGCRWRPGASL